MVLCRMGPAVQMVGPLGKRLGMYAFRNTFLYCFLSGVSFTMSHFLILYKVRMPRRRKLQKHEIGEGFFDDLLKEAKDAVHKHAELTKTKHMADLKKHLKSGASRIYAAKNKKGEAAKIKKELVAKAKERAHAIAEAGKARAHAHVEKLKQKALKRVRTRVCGGAEVGEGFFGNLFSGIKNVVGKLFGAGKKHVAQAVSQGVQTVKDKVKAAPQAIKAHVIKHKDEYVQKAVEAATDVVQNGKEGVHRQMGKARTHMVKKARSVAGCEEKKGGGLRVAGGLRKKKKKKKRGGSLSATYAGATPAQQKEAMRDAWMNYKATEGTPPRRGAGLKRKKSRKGRGMRMAGGLQFKGSGLRIVG